MTRIEEDQIAALRPDALTPAQIAAKAQAVGDTKANMPLGRAFVLAVFAGAFIAFGATFMLLVKGDATLSFATSQVLGGLCFSVGLFLVVTAGAELFTGNNLMAIGTLAGKYPASKLLRSWVVVYLGNLVGSLIMVALVHLANFRGMGGGAVGEAIVTVAANKVTPSLSVLFFRGVLCNILVCLAVWMSFGARTVVDKLCVCVMPVMAFVACGFEHSVANMFFLPLGLVTKLSGVAPAALAPEALAALDMGGILANLGMVTLGNLVGGALLVGVGYWFAYVRKQG